MGYKRPRPQRISHRNLGKRGSQAARVEALHQRQAEARAHVRGRRCGRGRRLHSEVEVLVHALSAVDERAAVWCATWCARTALPLVAGLWVSIGTVATATAALEIAEAWSHPLGPPEARPSRRQCREVAHTARETAARLFGSARDAALAAARAAKGAWRPGDAVAAVASAALARANTLARDWNVAGVQPYREVTADLLVQVQSLRWPLTVPSRARLRAARGGAAVAWDRVATHGDHTVSELLGAHERARRLGLRWEDPIERAVAERAHDEADIARLLAG
jgi:hypothetical protein